MSQNVTSKILVTGGAGFFGGHICEQLLRDGKQVVLFDVLNEETSTHKEKNFHNRLPRDYCSGRPRCSSLSPGRRYPRRVADDPNIGS